MFASIIIMLDAERQKVARVASRPENDGLKQNPARLAWAIETMVTRRESKPSFAGLLACDSFP